MENLTNNYFRWGCQISPSSSQRSFTSMDGRNKVTPYKSTNLLHSIDFNGIDAIWKINYYGKLIVVVGAEKSIDQYQ